MQRLAQRKAPLVLTNPRGAHKGFLLCDPFLHKLFQSVLLWSSYYPCIWELFCVEEGTTSVTTRCWPQQLDRDQSRVILDLNDCLKAATIVLLLPSLSYTCSMTSAWSCKFVSSFKALISVARSQMWTKSRTWCSRRLVFFENQRSSEKRSSSTSNLPA